MSASQSSSEIAYNGSMKILVIEDDREAADYMQKAFAEAGHTAHVAGDGETGFALADAGDYDVMVVDRMMPRRDGLSVIAGLRSRGNTTPVLILSALGEVDDRVTGLRAGGDDYLTKPFALAELLARIDAVLRRTHFVPSVLPVPPVPPPCVDHLTFDDVVIEVGQRLVTRGGTEVKLTHLEFELLVFFVTHPSQVFSRNQLFNLVWGQSAGSVRTVDNFVGQLRKRWNSWRSPTNTMSTGSGGKAWHG